MRLHGVRIGETEIKNNVWLAPLAGYTNAPLRKIALESGAGFCFTEMVSAKGLCYGSENTEALLLVLPEEKGRAGVQIFGNDPVFMRRAAESEALAPFVVVDINMGCPVPKIYKNGEGSALLENPRLAEKIVSETVKSGKTVTVKCRIGVTRENIVATEFCKRMEGAGASAVTVHGRTRQEMYSGEPDYQAIAAVKNALSVPVIANGGIFSVADAERMLDKTGADGVEIARAALYDPQIFCDFSGEKRKPFYALVKRQTEETEKLYGERFATVFMRKMTAFYLRGERNASAYKARLFECKTPAEVISLAAEISERLQREQ
ncbi:MAG: tRNA dihydrouridine synthase [Candidatus Scatosoma sp.]